MLRENTSAGVAFRMSIADKNPNGTQFGKVPYSKDRSANKPTKRVDGDTWHNTLPRWIVEDPEHLRLRQGPRHTLQTMADRCDAPPPDESDAPLLPCFGGDLLIAACGCSRSAFKVHVAALTDLGYLVPLTSGGGRLATVYAIPGAPGQLDQCRSTAGETARRWTIADSAKVRRLVAGNRPLAVSGRKQTPRGSETDRQGVGNRPLPSSYTSALTPNDPEGRAEPEPDQSDLSLPYDDDRKPDPDRTADPTPDPDPETGSLVLELPDSANGTAVKKFLTDQGIDAGRAHKQSMNADCTPELVRQVMVRVRPNMATITNPGGYIAGLVDESLDLVQQTRDKQRTAAAGRHRSECDALVANFDDLTDEELQPFIELHFPNATTAVVRSDPILKIEIARAMVAAEATA